MIRLISNLTLNLMKVKEKTRIIKKLIGNKKFKISIKKS